eukprot:gnl/Dysnectes_brevis/1436_a1627_1702.p1 GENE.gnl/Dysnectes_brevis/1436_a1627_1702~~gnl/Dysnectes_brevis/1436_a1627_1702.p1  ORF type:complete len:573 (-),score=125.42 gnl/Dysnectes_brevis/1436_a1627_1702:659-2377(-)
MALKNAKGKKRIISIDILRGIAIFAMCVGHSLSADVFDSEDFLLGDNNVMHAIIFLPIILLAVLFGNWKGVFSIISGVVIGYLAAVKHHRLLTRKHLHSSTPNIRSHIMLEVNSCIRGLFVWIGLTLALFFSNVIESLQGAYADGKMSNFFSHDYRITARNNPCGCFALLIGVTQLITGITVVAGLLRQRRKERGDDSQLEPSELSTDTIECTDTPSPGTSDLFYSKVVWCSIALLVIFSIISAFLFRPVDQAIVRRWKHLATAQGLDADVITTTEDIAKAPWIVLNTESGNSFRWYLRALVASEVTAPIMGLFPFTVGSLAGAALGMWMGMLGTTTGDIKRQTRDRFWWLMLIPVLQLEVASLWAVFGTEFKGSMILFALGLSETSESLTHHGGNYELFLCSGQLPVVLWAIWRWDLKEGIDRDRILRKSLWLRRFGSYSLSCFVYDSLFLGVMHAVSALYLPACRGVDGATLQPCQGSWGLLSMLFGGMGACYGLLLLFDRVHGLFSMDWWLSAFGGVAISLTTASKRGADNGLLAAIKPRTDRNHKGVVPVVLWDGARGDEEMAGARSQ